MVDARFREGKSRRSSSVAHQPDGTRDDALLGTRRERPRKDDRRGGVTGNGKSLLQPWWRDQERSNPLGGRRGQTLAPAGVQPTARAKRGIIVACRARAAGREQTLRCLSSDAPKQFATAAQGMTPLEAALPPPIRRARVPPGMYPLGDRHFA